MSHYVIIGNSAAAVGCIEGIRKHDADGRITVLSREPYHTYSRPLISYLLLHATDEKRMQYRPDSFYTDNRVTFRGSCNAVGVDAKARRVTYVSASGGQEQTLTYDRLMLATGSDPFIPPTPGYETVENAGTFMTLDDAYRLRRTVRPDSRVLIVGAGLIGLKCAEGLREMFDGPVTPHLEIVDLAPRVLASILEDEPAQLVRQVLEKEGIGITLGDSVETFEPHRALLKSGKTIDFDVLVMCVGVRPNTALAKSAGCRVERGIPVNAHGETDVPGIYAAGDCTQTTDISSGQSRVMAILPNAYMQGFAAGCSMAGAPDAAGGAFDRAIPMNSIGFFGLHIVSAGTYAFPEGEDVTVYQTTKPDGSYKKLIVKDGVLKGFMLIGDIARAGIYTALIREQTPLAELDFDLMLQAPQLSAFTWDRRRRTLAEEV